MDFVTPISFLVIYFILISRVKFFSFYGTIERGQYALIYILYLLIFLIPLSIFPLSIFSFDSPNLLSFEISFFIFVRLLRLTFDVRRFHDFGASGWWSLLFFIPLISIGEKSEPFVECQHCKTKCNISVLNNNNYYLDVAPVNK